MFLCFPTCYRTFHLPVRQTTVRFLFLRRPNSQVDEIAYYKYSCQCYRVLHFGQTRRHFYTQISEHMRVSPFVGYVVRTRNRAWSARNTCSAWLRELRNNSFCIWYVWAFKSDVTQDDFLRRFLTQQCCTKVVAWQTRQFFVQQGGSLCA